MSMADPVIKEPIAATRPRRRREGLRGVHVLPETQLVDGDAQPAGQGGTEASLGDMLAELPAAIGPDLHPQQVGELELRQTTPATQLAEAVHRCLTGCAALGFRAHRCNYELLFADGDATMKNRAALLEQPAPWPTPAKEESTVSIVPTHPGQENGLMACWRRCRTSLAVARREETAAFHELGSAGAETYRAVRRRLDVAMAAEVQAWAAVSELLGLGVGEGRDRESSAHWYCANCQAWSVCDDHDLCFGCGGQAPGSGAQLSVHLVGAGTAPAGARR